MITRDSVTFIITSLDFELVHADDDGIKR